MTWLGFSRFHAPVVICEKVVPIAIQASAFCTISFALFHPKEPTTPAKRGWSSDMTPRPHQDGETNGIPRATAKRHSSPAACESYTPGPMKRLVVSAGERGRAPSGERGDTYMKICVGA